MREVAVMADIVVFWSLRDGREVEVEWRGGLED